MALSKDPKPEAGQMAIGYAECRLFFHTLSEVTRLLFAEECQSLCKYTVQKSSCTKMGAVNSFTICLPTFEGLVCVC